MNRRAFFILMASLLLLAACVPTPDEAIVIGKDQSGMIDKATETIPPQMQTLSLRERLDVPDRLTYSYQKGDLTIDAEESAYGLYIKGVNGLTADYAADGAYWGIYVNGEYGQFGIESQPVADGDAFSLVYEKY